MSANREPTEEIVEYIAAKYKPNGDCPEFQFTILETPIGAMMAIGSAEHLYLLYHIEKFALERKITVMQKRVGFSLVRGDNPVLASIASELTGYFAGALREFRTPLRLTGTAFQNLVYEEVLRIPYGGSMSYLAIADRIGKPSSFRAAAQAIAQDSLLIVVPCHRVIAADGKTGGCAAGAYGKPRLLEFENSVLAQEGSG